MRRLMLIAVVLSLACHRERAEQPAKPATPAAPTPVATTSAPAPTAASRVLRADGTELLAISESGGDVAIAFTENGTKRTLHGDAKDSGKRKYNIDTGAVLFEVKPGDDGFKLRTADGTLRWKVKIKQDKVKISDNEENANPFEVKTREGDRFKVVGPGDRELGMVRFDRAASRTTIEGADGKTRYVVEGSELRGAYGALVLDSIPDVQRYILVAELLSRGR